GTCSAPTSSSTTRPRATAACCGRATATWPPRSAPAAGPRSRPWGSSTYPARAPEAPARQGKGRGGMTAQDAGLDAEFRQRVAGTMIAVLARLLERDEPITEDMRLMEELGLSSTFGLELLLQLEDELAILIDVERMDTEQTATVGALATFIAGNSRPA